MDSTQISTDVAKTVSQLIAEALRTSPTKGNGYGLLLAILLGLIVLAAVFVIWRVKIADARATEDRQRERDDRATKFDELKAAIQSIADTQQREFRELRDKSYSLSERLAKLEGNHGANGV
jgi:uncharacterized protein HemX